MAREELKAFIKESSKKRSFSEDDAQYYSGQEKAVKRSKSSLIPPQPDDIDTTLKLQHNSEENPELRYTDAQLDSGRRNESLLPILRKSSNQLKQRGEVESESTGLNLSSVGIALRVNQKFSNGSPKSLVKYDPDSIQRGPAKAVPFNEDMKKVQRVPDTPDQNTSRRHPIAASTSGRKRKKTDIYRRVAKRKVLEDDSDEASLQREAGVQEPGSGAGGCGEVDGDDLELDEDCVGKSEYVERSGYFR